MTARIHYHEHPPRVFVIDNDLAGETYHLILLAIGATEKEYKQQLLILNGEMDWIRLQSSKAKDMGFTLLRLSY
jgi:hypothetical protein